MYSYEDRIKAVELYIKYDQSAAATVQELGYPSYKMLIRWYKEFKETGALHEKFTRSSTYTSDQMKAAVNYYLEHGRCISRTVRAIGYPTRETLAGWIDELVPGERKIHIRRGAMLQFSKEQKKDAVIELCTRESAAAAVADRHGVSRISLYKWKKELLGEEKTRTMDGTGKPPLPDDRDALLAEVESLKKEIYRKQMELDILNKAAEIIKKGQGINPRELTNKEKVCLIDALRMKYQLKELLRMTNMPKSSYFYQKEAQSRPDKYSALRTEVIEVFADNRSRYGYRRLHAVIKSKGKIISEKVVRRIMGEEKLVVPCKKKRKYSSYKGEISPAVENVVARDFHAGAPNTKWLTDLTEFHIPAGKVYLSPIIDCFDGMVVSWTIGTSPDAELVNTMLDEAICNLTYGEHPIVHSDRGCHYRWPGWISRMGNSGLTRSMSKKGCSPDNSACEGFFGRLKNEMFYYCSWQDVSIEQFTNELDSYLRWYNEKRIKMSLGAMSPVDYRRSMGFAA
ncbi:IS3 family transposase [Candidatus Nomurabacteria bacterium]|nr:IS3 family transposase [Candidatus Nomurabacteria bacterium]